MATLKQPKTAAGFVTAEARSPGAARTTVRLGGKIVESDEIGVSYQSTHPLRLADASGSGAAFREFLSSDDGAVADAWRLIEHGISADWVKDLAARMSMSQARLISMLGLPRNAARRRAGAPRRLSPSQSSRVLGLYCLIRTVEAIVEESGDPQGFNAADWLSGWLQSSLPALGGRQPAEFLCTREGQQLVWSVLGRIQSGAFS
jgi:putative toxin-antitoxin system antitoxin component (TIGR02293 family)